LASHYPSVILCYHAAAMKVILTGAGGFIGSCYLWKLNSMGITDVYAVDTDPAPDKYHTLEHKKYKDYLSREQLLGDLSAGKFSDVGAIVHLGACADTTEMDRAFLARNNVQYSQTLASWAFSKNTIFHYASSASVYGDGKQGYSDDLDKLSMYKPLNPYAESKYLFDQWLINEKLTDKVVGFRYFNVYGPNEYHKGEMRSMVTKAYDQIRTGGRVKLFASSRPGFADGGEERDFVYVKDVCDVMGYFLENPSRHGILNLGSGE
jgi:ADP-L-glycero-D-manno-heptose 6-epimerase